VDKTYSVASIICVSIWNLDSVATLEPRILTSLLDFFWGGGGTCALMLLSPPALSEPDLTVKQSDRF